MKYTSKFLLILLLAGLGFQGCKKEQPGPELPLLTNEGKNVFGCKVNGAIWLPDYDRAYTSSRPIQGDYYAGGFTISVSGFSEGQNMHQTLYINMAGGVFETGRYELNGEDIATGFVDWETGCEYRMSTLNDGWIEFTYLDTIANIASGRLKFSITDPECGTINVTEGVFDIRI